MVESLKVRWGEVGFDVGKCERVNVNVVRVAVK